MTIDFQLRPYQSNIVDEIGSANAILKMPTGSGKTIVAARIIQNQLNRDDNRAAIFLVPARELVDQQSKVVKEWCPDAVVLPFRGGLADPPTEESQGKVCIVSTPQAFLDLQRRENHVFGWHAFGLVVFDEVHHVLKDHPYRCIALKLLAWHEGQIDPQDQRVQILGLSASLTYDVTEAKVMSTLNRLCSEMSIEKMLCPSAIDMEDGGYVPQYGRNVELESLTEVPEGCVPKSERKNHLMHAAFLDRVQKATATVFSMKVWHAIKKLEEEAIAADPTFRSPVNNPKLSSWEQDASDKAFGQPWNMQIFNLLETWYTALRLLVQTWEEEEVLVMKWLQMKGAFDHIVCQETEAVRVMAEDPANFYRLGRLRHHLIEKRQLKADEFKCIVFVQQRIAAVILSGYINNDPELQDYGFRSGFVTAEGKITPSIKVTKRVAAETLQQFRSGELNVIVATNVLEEGIDVPDANVLISYNHLKDVVELCQRLGRARAQESAIVILDERTDRPLEMLHRVRLMQDEIIETFEPSVSQMNRATAESRQLSKEQAAFRAILQRHPRCQQHSIQAIHEYTAKTKASLTDEYTTQVDGMFQCTLTYQSFLHSFIVKAVHTSKKTSKQNCALELLTALENALYFD